MPLFSKRQGRHLKSVLSAAAASAGNNPPIVSPYQSRQAQDQEDDQENEENEAKDHCLWNHVEGSAGAQKLTIAAITEVTFEFVGAKTADLITQGHWEFADTIW
jgi:hypothetical protein